MFKVGDRLKCIDNEKCLVKLQKEAIYIFDRYSYNNSFLFIKDYPSSLILSDRFVAIKSKNLPKDLL